MKKTKIKSAVKIALLTSSLAFVVPSIMANQQKPSGPAKFTNIEEAKRALEKQLMFRKGLAKKGEFLVKFKSNQFSVSSMQSSLTLAAGSYAGIVQMRAMGRGKKKKFKFGSRTNTTSSLDQWMHLILADNADEAQVVARLKADPNIEIVEPNYRVSIDAIPNDPRFSELWGLNNTGQSGGSNDADIDAPEAWDTSIGSGMVVAVIDTGVDYNHPDIAANMWVNPGEIAGNNIDDDGNGYVDDIHGYDFFSDDGDPMDENNHGTHVAGTIAAVGNNGIGVTGTAYGAKIMALRFLGPEGGSTADAALAIAYATQMGAKIMNNSWGGGGFAEVLQDAINDAEDADTLFIAAAGNAGSDNDVIANYPSNYANNNLVAVAATDRNDKMAGFSSFGRYSVDLGAPGVAILSTIRNNAYAFFRGTSMATPHVSGAAAVVWANNPQLSAMEMKQLLMGTADPIIALAGKTTTGARLNVENALNCDASLDHLVISQPGTQAPVFRDTPFKDEPSITLTAYLHNCTSGITRTHVVASFSNGENPVLMLDDGLHNDFAPNDGIYGGAWNPVNLGPVTISFNALEDTSNLLVIRDVTVVEDTDIDKDGLDNAFEQSIGTDPLNRDTDKDQLSDGFEVCFDGDCSSYDPYPAGGDLNPFIADTDMDGFDDGQEFLFAGNGVDPKLSPWEKITITGGASPANGPPSDLFTASMVNVGDLNRDGVNDFAIGHPFSQDPFVRGAIVNGGRVTVYSGKDQSTLFEINDPSELLGFGGSIMTIGDNNNDGINDIIVTNEYDPQIGTYSMIHYSGVDGSELSRWDITPKVIGDEILVIPLEYDRDNDGSKDILRKTGTFLEIVSGKTGDTIFTYNNSRFPGEEVSMLGDLNNDGIPEIILGNPFAGLRKGMAVVISGIDGSRLYFYQGQENLDLLGTSVANMGDIDQDGIADFAIGSLRETLSTATSGLVTVYSGADGSPIYRFEGPEARDRYSFVAPFDLGDDKIPDIMISAQLGSKFDDISDNSGRIYVYRGSDGSLATEIHPSVVSFGQLAISLGDVNNDGTDDMLFSDSISFLKTRAFVMLSPPPTPKLDNWKQGNGPFVQLNGSHLLGATHVTFNGVPALGFSVQNSFSASVIRPLNVTTGPICITSPVATSCAPDDYIAPPVITSWTQQGGSFVSIQGENLQQTKRVTFNGVAGRTRASNTNIELYLGNTTINYYRDKNAHLRDNHNRSSLY